MLTAPMTQLLVTAFQASAQMHNRHTEIEQGRIQLRALEANLMNQYDMAELQASVVRDLIHALIERRIDAVQTGFTHILALFAEQARHYLQQQERFVEESFRLTDPLQRANYQARLLEIDRQLAQIRADAHLLYHEMNTMLLLIGQSAPPMHPDVKRTLLLT